MRWAICLSLVCATLGCGAVSSARQRAPSPVTRADSARITTAFLRSITGDSAARLTLAQLIARRDSIEAAVKANPRRYELLRVF